MRVGRDRVASVPLTAFLGVRVVRAVRSTESRGEPA